MASKKNQLVLPFGKGWAVVKEGCKIFTVCTIRKSQAVSFARDIAKQEKTGLIVYGRDGIVRQRSNYRTTSRNTSPRPRP